MEVLRLVDLTKSDACVVALGFFDGVHIGHRALLEKTVAEAKERGATPCIFTFADSPAFKGGERLFAEEARLSAFADCGIERVVLADFPALASLSPEEFVSEILLEKLHTVAAVCGFNYRFGARAAGDAALLCSLLATHGAPLFLIAEMTHGGKTVSTTAIKAALAEGDADTAAAMLGRAYAHTGVVTHGKALGRKIGVPTANIPFPDRSFLPKRGVWAVSCEIEGVTERALGVANVGVRPTVEKGASENCEVHFFSPMPDLYGRRVRVSFHSFIRPEMAFEDIATLTERITLDKQIAKEFFDTWNGQN